jgi:hypothetical protein
MLFFQTVLLAGYAYAHFSTRELRPKSQAVLHLALVAAGVCALPIVPDRSILPVGSSAPVLHVLAVLAKSVALPYFVLCGSTPLLQAWAARDRAVASPYRLYALSNAGSMLALLSYPIAVEPWWTTRVQEWVWSGAFVAFALASAVCARRVWSSGLQANVAAATDEDPTAPAPTFARRMLWLALAACASTLLLAVTNQMCQEVAVVPLLWILPLAVYLLSFVLCFESDRWYSRTWCLPVLILTLLVLAQALALGARVGVLYAVPVYSIGLFVCCMFCHGELAARRPAARHLTSFYLMVALGGALGGVFVSVVSPQIFRGFDELYVGLLACGLFAGGFTLQSLRARVPRAPRWSPTMLAIAVAVVLIGAILGMRVVMRTRPGLRELRNFYGILRIQDLYAPDGSGPMRYMTHGGTRHGQQYQDSARRSEPTAYFGRVSGAGILFDELSSRPSLHVGIIGLGAGVLAAYVRPGDVFRFYEINPQVIDVARSDFTFVGDAPGVVEIADGDARLSLEREENHGFDVLVLDAFSSDAIPVHLLTKEAFELYQRHLAPGGVLALHVTTRHLDLGPLIASLARELGLDTWEVRSAADDAHALLDARWIFVTANRELLAQPRIRSAGQPIELHGPLPRVWTDDFSNLVAVLK